MSNVVLGIYYNTKIDVQRNRKADSDSYEYIKRWYESIISLGMKGLLLVDESCSDSFIKKYQNEHISIKRRNEVGCGSFEYSICVNRFIDFIPLLESTEYEKVLMTDVSDVHFKKDPFPLFKKEHICMQHEQHHNGFAVVTKTSQWARQVFSTAYENYPYWDKPLMNCGIIGGYREDIYSLLVNFEQEARLYKERTGDEGGVHDMSFMNYLVHQRPILTGMPLHTIFKAYDDNNPNAYVVHK